MTRLYLHEEEAISCYYRWLDAFNLRDIEGMLNEMHFPHWRISWNNSLQVWQTEDQQRELHDGMTDNLQLEGWVRTISTGLRVIHSSKTKVHIAMRQSRLNDLNEEYNGFETLWIMCLIKGRWGAQFRSSFSNGVSEIGVLTK